LVDDQSIDRSVNGSYSLLVFPIFYDPLQLLDLNADLFVVICHVHIYSMKCFAVFPDDKAFQWSWY